ncbi:MAG: RIP metalloprotease RseP [Sulfurospirillaceae bacterium]|nr:RIP metalloprotease RseP [Sulfurospirillaceae bacterium]MDD2827354.1 RIP metalloprotease RseP [Sulfurospirillaceae bacterium]
MGTLTSILVLSFLIFFHELGHFLAARYFGVRVEVFSIGFGKKVFSKVIGQTEYCISLIPLGGYVQMKGQNDMDPLAISQDRDSYNTKHPWQRIIILFAGPFSNFLLAFLLYLVIGTNGVTYLSPTIGAISDNSPAQSIGLQKDDMIVQINGLMIKTWDDVSTSIKESEGLLELKVARQNEIKNFIVTPLMTPVQNIFKETVYKRIVGIAPSGQTITIHYGANEIFGFALDQTQKATTMILTSLQKLIEGVVPVKELGGIISIVQVTSEASHSGIIALLGLTALISVNLGVLNLLPIPALDGGHMMFNTYELLTRKAPSERVLYFMTMGGWALLLSLTALSIFNDIYRIAGGN